MKKLHFLILLLVIPMMLGADGGDDCCPCRDEKKKMSSLQVADDLGISEPAAAIALDEAGFEPILQNGDLVYVLTDSDMDTLAMEVD